MAFLRIPELNSRLGTYRAYHLAAIAFLAAFLSGYDSGIIGGILTYAPFQDSYHFGKDNSSTVQSLTVGLSQAGSWVAAMLIYPITNAFGRRWAVIGSTSVFLVGTIIQTIDTGSLGGWYVGRVVAGLGIGGMTVVIPMYSAEMTPKEIRGRCGSFYQWMYAWGVFLAYWVDYGVHDNPSIANTHAIYQIPIGLQFIPATVLLVGMFLLPESVRWLLSKDRVDEAWSSICWIRGDDGERTLDEFKETELGLKAERAATDSFDIRELFKPENRLRFILGPMLFMFQNTTGSSALAVFAPQYFTVLVGDSESRDLLLTGLFGAMKVIACTIFIWFISERFGRRVLLTGGSALMAACMLITALIAKFVPTTDASGGVTNGGRATVAMIYLDIMVYNCSWGPLPWAYVPEIFPTRIRSLGLAVSMLAHWATSVTFSVASPYMIRDIGAWSFLVFMGFDIIASIFCFVLVRETRGKVLERAAGTEWEIAERKVIGGEEYADVDLGEKGAPVHITGDGTVVDEVHGKVLEINAVHDTFGTNLKKRS